MLPSFTLMWRMSAGSPGMGWGSGSSLRPTLLKLLWSSLGGRCVGGVGGDGGGGGGKHGTATRNEAGCGSIAILVCLLFQCLIVFTPRKTLINFHIGCLNKKFNSCLFFLSFSLLFLFLCRLLCPVIGRCFQYLPCSDNMKEKHVLALPTALRTADANHHI